MRGWRMVLAAMAGLFGAAGVALAAAGAHAIASPLVATAADFLLFHAAALVGLCAASGDRGVTIAATLLASGTLLFSGELALHALAGIQPLPIAAPVGGLLTIAGWIAVAIALPVALRRRG